MILPIPLLFSKSRNGSTNSEVNWETTFQLLFWAINAISRDNALFLARKLKSSLVFFIFRYVKSVGSEHFDTSAKTGKGLDDAFMSLTLSLMKNTDNDPTGSRIKTMKRHTSVRIVSDQSDQVKPVATSSSGSSGGCCN